MPVDTQLLGFIHETSIEGLASIASSGGLLSGFERAASGIAQSYGFTVDDGDIETFLPGNHPGSQFNAVFMGIVTSDMVGEEIRRVHRDASVTLLFCKTLLDREDWHVNINDENGYISSRNTLADNGTDLNNRGRLMEYLTGDHEISVPEEIMFHHGVSLGYLRAVIVQTDELAGRVSEILDDRFPNAVVVVSDTFPDHIGECSPIAPLPANICFIPDEYERNSMEGAEGLNESTEFYETLARNCYARDSVELRDCNAVPAEERQRCTDDNNWDLYDSIVEKVNTEMRINYRIMLNRLIDRKDVQSLLLYADAIVELLRREEKFEPLLSVLRAKDECALEALLNDRAVIHRMFSISGGHHGGVSAPYLGIQFRN